MKNRDCRRFVGFVLITIALAAFGVLASIFLAYLMLHGDFGGIYWGIIFPIFWYLILMIFVVAGASYFGSWIYFSKSKGYSRWLGMLAIIPTLGPLILIWLKPKNTPPPEDSFPVAVAQILGVIMPIVFLISVPLLLSSINWGKDSAKENIIQNNNIENLY